MDDFKLEYPLLGSDSDTTALVAAGLTHDVRGALSGIRLRALVAADELHKGDANAVLRSLARIDVVVALISDLCDDLLECSRRRGRSSMPELVRFNLSQLVRACLEAQFSTYGTKCDLELLVQPEAWLLSHPLSVERVLVNLVRNALRHGAGGKIWVAVASDDCRVSLTVRDSGRGMAPDVLERVREPYQSGEPVEASFKSFGLGLWIVSSLVASLEGTLDIRSEPGVGTSMTVHLPLVPGGPMSTSRC